MKRVTYLLLLLLITGTAPLFAQKKIVFIGSSTVEGVGANPIADSSFVNRVQKYFRKNTSPGNPDTVVYNLGMSGTYSATGLPVAMYGDPDRNVEKAMSYNPDVVIISYVSNDAHYNVPLSETLDNLRTMYNYVVAAGKRCFITTTQPRDFSGYPAKRQKQKDTRDSILAEYGSNAINFWDDIANANYTINSAYSAGDGIHINNNGHRALYSRTVAKDLFISSVLPIKLLNFSASLRYKKVQLNWRAETDNNFDKFIVERSSNGRTFSVINESKSAKDGTSVVSDYQATDDAPLTGVSYYRVGLIDKNNIRQYSNIARIVNGSQKFALRTAYSASSDIIIRMDVKEKQTIDVQITNASGQVIARKNTVVDEYTQLIRLQNIGVGGKGIYYVYVTNQNKETAVLPFIKE